MPYHADHRQSMECPAQHEQVPDDEWTQRRNPMLPRRAGAGHWLPHLRLAGRCDDPGLRQYFDSVETPPMRSTGLQPFDFISIAGSVDVATGTMEIVVQLSSIDPGQPNIHQEVGTDKYGLGANRITMDGAALGSAIVPRHNRRRRAFDPFDGLLLSRRDQPTSNTSGCPTPRLQPNVSFENRTATAETNKLIQIGAPSVSYPNPYLAVTNVTATTSGACIDPSTSTCGTTTRTAAQFDRRSGAGIWESRDNLLFPKTRRWTRILHPTDTDHG